MLQLLKKLSTNCDCFFFNESVKQNVTFGPQIVCVRRQTFQQCLSYIVLPNGNNSLTGYKGHKIITMKRFITQTARLACGCRRPLHSWEIKENNWCNVVFVAQSFPPPMLTTVEAANKVSDE